MIRFACPQCGKEFSVADEHAGQKARCKKCGAIITIAAAPAVSSAQPANAAGARAKLPSAAPARTVAPARSAQRPPAARTSRSPAGTPAAASPRPASPPAASPSTTGANDPFGGLNIDLGALGPFDASGLSAPLDGGVMLGGGMTLGSGASLGHKYAKKKKSGNLLLWLVFSGSGLALVAIAAIVAATLINLPASETFPDDPTAYLPASSAIRFSVRLRNLLDRVSSIPQAKPKIDEALSTAIAEGLDPRDIVELFVVSEGTKSSIAARIARPLDLLTVKGTVATGESHQGLPIYSAKLNARPRPGMAMPASETLYLVLPTQQLLVGGNDLQRLKAAIDQAKERRAGTIDLPSGHDLALRIKDFSQLARGAALPAGAESDVLGLTGTLDFNENLSLDVQLDMKDAQKASEVDQKIKSALQMLTMLSKRSQPNAPDLSRAINVSMAGAQLRLSAAVPASQLSSLAASVPGTPAVPGNAAPSGTPPGMPGGAMPPGGQRNAP